MGRPITVNVGPLATADADGIAKSQLAAAAQYLALDGDLSVGVDADGIALAQNPAGPGALTLNGVLVVSGVARLGKMTRVYLTCAGDETDRTFTVTGIGMDAAGTFSVVDSFVGGNASVRASNKLFYQVTSITTSGAGSGNISVGTSGVGTLDVARRVIITSGGNDTGIFFTITGTNASGLTITETLTGVSGAAAQSALDFKTVTSVLTSGAAASTLLVGTNAVASSPWVRFDDYAALSEVSIQCTVSGTVNYTVEQTMQDPNAAPPDAVAADDVAWLSHPDTALVAATATKQGNYGFAPAFARVTLNSGTGSVSSIFRQAYLS